MKILIGNTFVVKVAYMIFSKRNIEEIVALHPRTEALETPILDPKKEQLTSEYGGYSYFDTEIKVDESRQQ